jgi:hypothetical protein
MQHEPVALIAIFAAGVVVLAIALLAFRMHKRRRSAALREHFGPEYERALAQHGDRARAELELSGRKKHLQELDIRALSAEQCERFGAAWSEVQQDFIEDPGGAVIDADALVKEVLKACGYPVGNFEQRVADLSVEHANVVHHYRAARTIALDSAKGQAGTEDLRQAMVHYRSLFNDLLPAQEVSARLSEAPA